MPQPRSDSEKSIDYWEVKARREFILAERDQLELDIVRRNVVVRNDVHKAAFEASRKLRDRLHSICKQSSPVIIGLETPLQIEQHLRDEIDLALEDFIQNCV
jgi:hypothetical protein